MLAKQVVTTLSLSGEFDVVETLSVSWNLQSEGSFNLTPVFQKFCYFQFYLP